MITLSAIWLYPVKGLRGHPVEVATVEPRGLAGDRRCMVVDENGAFVTQRQDPTLVRMAARWIGRSIALTHEGAAVDVDLEHAGPSVDVRVWASDVRAVELPLGSEFVSAALGRRCRLVRLPESERRAVTSSAGIEGDQVSFADAFPYLLASTSSLDDLRARAGDSSLSMERFRPNLVVDGLPPWAEDGVAELTIGSVGFQNRKPCDRCSVTLVDPESGKPGKEPLKTLSTFRERDGKVYFGVNLVATSDGVVRVGDRFAVQRVKAPQ